MGLASSIGLGLALSKPDRKVVVFDGDGNALMNLGNMAMVGAWRPKNFVHIIFDNETYGSTGGQPTISKKVSLEKIARAAGYLHSRKVLSRRDLRLRFRQALKAKGPSLLLVKVSKETDHKIGRVNIPPRDLVNRMRGALK